MPKKQDAKDVALGCFVMIVIAAGLWFWFGNKDDTADNIDELLAKNLTITDIRNLAETQQKQLLSAYIDKHQQSFSHINPDWKWPLSCMKHMVKFKAEDIPINTFGSWCIEQAADPERNFYWDEEIFTKKLSSWDGSYEKLVNAVKASLHNPASFEHVRTQYRVQPPTKENPSVSVFVDMQYRGKNAFNAVVTEEVNVRVDPFSGEILEVIQ